MKKPTRLRLNSLLFSIFWWFIQKVSPKNGEKLLYWGLQSGAFPNRYRENPRLKTEVLGMKLKTPIGIGGGFDKRVGVIDDLIYMGAGFGEFGPYTLETEEPVTETFFLPRDKAIVVQSLGYKNFGLLNMVPAFINRRYLPNIVGINISITAEYEGENVKMGRVMTYAEEFDLMTRKIAPYCDFITVNFSHPETELSRIVSDASVMVPILKGIKRAVHGAAPIQKPKILVKIPLNVTPLELPLVCQNLMTAGVDGVVVGGALSLSQAKVKLSKKLYAGMLSGAPVKSYVLEMISKVHQFTKGNLPIVACGGVWSGQDAFDCLAAGASLIQIGTVLRYEGPKAVTKINQELADILKEKGIKSVSEVVGIDFK